MTRAGAALRRAYTSVVEGTRLTALPPQVALAIGGIFVILFVQFVLSLAEAIIARNVTDTVVESVFTSSAELVETRTEEHLDSVADAVNATAMNVKRDSLKLSDEELTQVLAESVMAHREIGAVGVAYPNGEFALLGITEGGFEENRARLTSGGEIRSERVVYDTEFRRLWTFRTSDTSPMFFSEYFSRAVTSGLEGSWSDAETLWSSGDFGATYTVPVIDNSGNLFAVVVGELPGRNLSSVLDELPLSVGGTAYLIDHEGNVLSTNSTNWDYVNDARDSGTGLVSAASVGIDFDSHGHHHDDQIHKHLFGSVHIVKNFEGLAGVSWQLQVNTSESAFGRTLPFFATITVAAVFLSGVLVLAAAWFLFWLRNPILELQSMATRDFLTGLPNRLEFWNKGAEIMEDATKNGDTIAVAMFDLDDFKSINDHQGHVAGDRALVEAAKALRNALEEGDFVARYGGDEFVVMLTVTGLQPFEVVESVRRAVEDGINETRRDGEAIGVTAGFAVSRRTKDLEVLAERADTALLNGKKVRKGTSYAEARGSFQGS